MNQGKLVFAQIAQHLPLTTFRRCVARYGGERKEAILAWCESNGIDYVLGLAKNNVLNGKIEKDLAKAEKKFKKTGRAARFFKDFQYSTINSWSRKRRVIGKAEHLEKGSNLIGDN